MVYPGDRDYPGGCGGGVSTASSSRAAAGGASARATEEVELLCRRRRSAVRAPRPPRWRLPLEGFAPLCSSARSSEDSRAMEPSVCRECGRLRAASCPRGGRPRGEAYEGKCAVFTISPFAAVNIHTRFRPPAVEPRVEAMKLALRGLRGRVRSTLTRGAAARCVGGGSGREVGADPVDQPLCRSPSGREIPQPTRKRRRRPPPRRAAADRAAAWYAQQAIVFALLLQVEEPVERQAPRLLLSARILREP